MARNFLVFDQYKKGTTCDGENIESAMAVQVGPGCIDTPMQPAKSFKILTCESSESTGYITLSLLLFLDSRCQGVGIPYGAAFDIPSQCNTKRNMKISCTAEPVSMTEKWPAVDISFNDELCGDSFISFAIKPGCIGHGMHGIGFQCENNNKYLSFQMFNSCIDSEPTNYLTIPVDYCLSALVSLPASTTAAITAVSALITEGARETHPATSSIHNSKDLRGAHSLYHSHDFDKAVGKQEESMLYEGYFVGRCGGY